MSNKIEKTIHNRSLSVLISVASISLSTNLYLDEYLNYEVELTTVNGITSAVLDQSRIYTRWALPFLNVFYNNSRRMKSAKKRLFAFIDGSKYSPDIT